MEILNQAAAWIFGLNQKFKDLEIRLACLMSKSSLHLLFTPILNQRSPGLRMERIYAITIIVM